MFFFFKDHSYILFGSCMTTQRAWPRPLQQAPIITKILKTRCAWGKKKTPGEGIYNCGLNTIEPCAGQKPVPMSSASDFAASGTRLGVLAALSLAARKRLIDATLWRFSQPRLHAHVQPICPLPTSQKIPIGICRFLSVNGTAVRPSVPGIAPLGGLLGVKKL